MMMAGMLGSLLLHSLIFVLLWPKGAVPPPDDLAIAVELVALADHRDTESGLADHSHLSLSVPDRILPSPSSTSPPARQQRPSTPMAKTKSSKALLPTDPFGAMLRDLKALRGTAMAKSPADADAKGKTILGQRGAQGVNDFIRAQIERCWEFDTRSLGQTALLLSLHIILADDGSVTKVEVVDDPRYKGNPLYRQLASSLRNAARIASPLQLPTGDYAAYRELTLQFNPRQALN